MHKYKPKLSLTLEHFKEPEDTISVQSDNRSPDNNIANLVEIKPFKEQDDEETTSLPDIIDNHTFSVPAPYDLCST